jgi:hypothetical protein
VVEAAMKAPKCQFCGVEEWGHLCSGAAPSEIERRATRGAVTKNPRPSVTKNTLVTKNQEGISVTSKKGRGRPKKAKASSAAERVKAFRERKAEALAALRKLGELK